MQVEGVLERVLRASHVEEGMEMAAQHTSLSLSGSEENSHMERRQYQE